jgi:glycosyltransferase involved in cell wall biosynthesis
MAISFLVAEQMKRVTAIPRLSIGLPVYNGENYLSQSLTSLLDQSYEDFELIISDNASTDSTPDICRLYEKQDSRIRYFRQPCNIGIAPNHNFVIREARGELIKTASHDDLYGHDLLKYCVEALDNYPDVVLAHSWSAVIDDSQTVTELVDYPVNTASRLASERFRSMLFDGWGDDNGGVMRRDVLRRTPLHGSYHFADRTFTIEMALHGPFYMVPERLYFRRCHAGQAGKSPTVRARCVNLNPKRANRLLHPTSRLYGEYIWGYTQAIRRAPLSRIERKRCYLLLARWAAGRVLPVSRRTLGVRGLQSPPSGSDADLSPRLTPLSPAGGWGSYVHDFDV